MTNAAPASIGPEQLSTARALAAEQDISIPLAIKHLMGCSDLRLLEVLSRLFNYSTLTSDQLRDVQPDTVALPFSECVRHKVALVRREDDQLVLITADPFDAEAEDWALNRCLSVNIAPRVALVSALDLQGHLDRIEQGLKAVDGLDVMETADGLPSAGDTINLASIADTSSAVVKLVNSTIYDAFRARASDIHLECDAGNLYVQYRIDGVMVPVTRVGSQELADQVISRVKVMAELDIAERRVPQDGRFKVRLGSRDVDFRVSVMPNIHGEDAVLRLLDRQSLSDGAEALSLDDLGLDRRAIEVIRKIATQPHGMMLVTGPTGSGKTTTLYGAITEIHTGRDKIVTIEDPVEYRLSRVLQIPVNEKKGLTFARGLRSILRHDPDKIMVGEIRDEETAQIAVQAALTGHLVFTTVHANNVFDVLSRFLHMGVDPYSLSAALNGVVAQRLVRVICSECSEHYDPTNDELAFFGLTTEAVCDWTFRRGRGCQSCRDIGFAGRRAVAEALTINDPIREAIASKASLGTFKELAVKAGMLDLRDSALELVRQGITTLDEVRRVVG